MKTTRVRKIIREEILSNRELSMDGARILGINQTSFRALARRNSDKLGHAHLVELYKKYGFKDEQIFEPEDKQAIYDTI